MAGLAIRSPVRPASSVRATLNLASESSSSAAGDDADDDADDYEDDEDAPLPFPAALPRSDFLTPDFHAATYLSELPHRHQTLEDLRSELRERSAAISAELLELVNGNYTAFLSLGDDLRGGDEKVEDVRVAMLGFRRAVEEVRSRIKARGGEVAGLSEELRGVRRDIETARRMLELDERVSALEARLSLASFAKASSEDDWFSNDGGSEEEDQDEEETGDLLGSSPAKLMELAQEYKSVEGLADAIGRDVPFVANVEGRLVSCRNTILLDLGTALKEARRVGGRGRARLVRYLGIYAGLGAEVEAVQTLRGK